MGLKMDKNTRRILRHFAFAGMNEHKAAAKLSISLFDLRRHLDEIKKKTGIDPRNFWGLICLQSISEWDFDIKNDKKRVEVMFFLWQIGCSDSTIADVIGLSRQAVQKWRDKLEIPSVFEISLTDRQMCLIDSNSIDGNFVVTRCNPRNR